MTGERPNSEITPIGLDLLHDKSSDFLILQFLFIILVIKYLKKLCY